VKSANASSGPGIPGMKIEPYLQLALSIIQKQDIEAGTSEHVLRWLNTNPSPGPVSTGAIQTEREDE
jgi:hypothetical protein